MICQGITPYSGDNTGVSIMYFGLYDREPLPTVGNNTVFWIMYSGLFDKKSLPTLGTIQVSGSIWEYMTGNHSLLFGTTQVSG